MERDQDVRRITEQLAPKAAGKDAQQ
jgi:hypothetical protein